MHLKRQNIGEFWPIPKKGTKYLTVSSHNQKSSIPLIVVMRDLLKLVKNKKELKKALNEKQIKINNKEIREVGFPVSLFDVISLTHSKKNYRSVLSNKKKMIFNEVSEKDAETRIYKIIGKKILSGKLVQLNLMDGRNIISKEKVNTGDSVLFNFNENKIIKIIPLEKGKNAFIIKGKHAGNEGKIDEIVSRGGKSIAKISCHKERINVWIKNLVVVE